VLLLCTTQNNHYKAVFDNPGPNVQGAIVAAIPAGSLVGSLSVTWLGDKIGRKRTIIIAGIIWVIGSTLQCAAMVSCFFSGSNYTFFFFSLNKSVIQSRGMLVAGRIISGISVGLSSAIVPIYQSEITAPAIRGRVIALQQWSITWGILIQYFIQFGCSYIDGVASFRIPWGLQMLPAILLSIGMIFFPESPRWLVDHDRLVVLIFFILSFL